MTSGAKQLSASEIEHEARRIVDRIVPGGHISADRRRDFVKSFRAFVGYLDIRLERLIDRMKDADIDTAKIESINDVWPVNKSLSGISRQDRSKPYIIPYVQWLLHDQKILEKYKFFVKQTSLVYAVTSDF